jgi:hypothetical protein
MSEPASDSVFVMVRGLADEPARLRLVGIRGTAIDAVGTDENCPMPFHLTRTYRFDEGLFVKLRMAFESSDRSALTELWDTAKPFEPRK